LLVCGVDLSASDARLALVRSTPEGFEHVACDTKKLSLADDTKAEDLATLLDAIKAFAHRNCVETFVIKSRAKKGQMAGGAVSFKIEALFLLSGTPVQFVSPQALAKFTKGNMGGVPGTVLGYQTDAFRAAALALSKAASA